uniref:Disease resistance protein RGA2 n=1 Tax=Aegilops tauschii TaxID=37682 RepID=R7WB62_AEGTA
MSISGTIGVISGINECVNLFQWARSSISSLHSRWSGKQEQNLQDEVLHLQSGLQCLSDTLPAMYNLIDRAEWRSHKHCVAELLPKFSDAVYDAEDILDEFRWYEQKVTVEGIASQSAFIDFFNCVIQGSFNKVKDIQKRLENLSNLLEKMGLGEATPRFDKSVRPETSSFPIETIMFGRDQELTQVIELLVVREGDSTTKAHSKGKRECRTINSSKRTLATINHVCNEQENGLAVLPIVGIGGVGKTTMAQHIYQQVKPHFKKTIWLSVSDDFDVKRLTKEALQSISGEESTGQLDSLQHALHKTVCQKKLLIVLDDLWDDALKENGQSWKRFCAPLKNVRKGSIMLVTTRSQKVADGVRTMKTLKLNGLKDDVFWNFFKLCMFGSERFSNDHELEQIGRSILPKLKGSPLAAKTLGRLLRMNRHTTYWNNVLESELWELRQQEDDILPALRLSYMYLPFYLKRCFSLCGVYPKDHEFEKDYLAEIWVAEGFVEPQGDIPIQDIASQYFEDLNNGTEALQLLQPPNGLKSLQLRDYPDVSLPRWFQPQKLSSLISLANIGIFTSLMDLAISDCHKLSSLEHFLHPASIPAIKKIVVRNCERLISVPTERFVEFHCLEELEVVYCRNICSRSLVAPSLKRLVLGCSGDLAHNIECCSLTSFFLYYSRHTSIHLQHLPALMSLSIARCESLTSVRPAIFTNFSHCGCNASGITSFLFLTVLTISGCTKLSTLDGLLTQECLPVVERIYIAHCDELLSLPGERFGSFLCLKDLEIYDCQRLDWQRGLVLPSTLQRLVLGQCGDISAWVPSCLQNLASLVSLEMSECPGITSIPGDIWRTNLASLEELYITDCPDLVSIGGLEAVAQLGTLHISGCPKMIEM